MNLKLNKNKWKLVMKFRLKLLGIDGMWDKKKQKKKEKRKVTSDICILAFVYSHLEFLKVPVPYLTSLFLHHKGENTRQQ